MLVRFDSPRTYDNLIENLLSSDFIPSRCEYPLMNIIETKNDIIVKAELPGVKKEDVKVTYESNVLTISCEQKPIEKSEDVNILLREIRNKSFNRSVKFGYSLDVSKMTAELSDGVLTITLPKTEEVKAKEIKIN